MKKLLAFSILAMAISAHAEVMKLDSTKSEIYWKGSKATGSFHEGNLKFKSGQIELKDGKIAAGNFVVDMNSLSNTDLAKTPDYQKKLVGHLLSEDFFNTAKHPEAKFVITSVIPKDAKNVTLKGDMTFNGKTNPIEVPATIELAKGSATGEATLKLDRTVWDLKYGSGKFFKNLGDKLINDEFELKLKLVATK